MLKRHLEQEGLMEGLVFREKDTGAWSLITMGWILVSEIVDMMELLMRKKSIREKDL